MANRLSVPDLPGRKLTEKQASATYFHSFHYKKRVHISFIFEECFLHVLSYELLQAAAAITSLPFDLPAARRAASELVEKLKIGNLTTIAAS